MGGVLAFAGAFQFGVVSGDTWIILIVVAALLFGFLAVAYGDRFWHALLGLLRWW